MSLILPITNGPFKGITIHYKGHELISINGHVYKVQTTGVLKMPTRYVYQGEAKKVNLNECIVLRPTAANNSKTASS